MQRYFKHVSVTLVLLLTLTGCETSIKSTEQAELTFTNLVPLRLNVASIEVQQTYQPPLTKPNVDHLFKTPPVQVMTNWAKYRFRANGGTDRALVIIKNASVKQVILKKDKSFTGIFTQQQSRRYDMNAEIIVKIIGPGGVQKAVASAIAKRSKTIREDANLNQRDQIWFTMEERLMDDLNKEIEAKSRRYLGGWLN